VIRVDDLERPVGMGATRVKSAKGPPDADDAILPDPEGNRFCVVDAAS
jgi:hypothetical protein